MARDVQNVIAEMIGKNLDGDDSGLEKGKAFIEEMKTKGRFLLDIWS
jgi:sulfite reductase alpha subunit-like flavoprotein